MTESTVVLGALSFGTRVDEVASMDLLDQFEDLGGSWIDTANNYSFWLDPSGSGGQSETVIGRWLAARPGIRDRIRISTKAGRGSPGTRSYWRGSAARRPQSHRSSVSPHPSTSPRRWPPGTCG
jgi:aryl-alcohol dehydrogenase-like predicted oxidoreductase